MLLVKLVNLREDNFKRPECVVAYNSGAYYEFWHAAGLWLSPREFLKDSESIGLLDFYDKALASIKGELSAYDMARVREDALYALALIHHSRNGKYIMHKRRLSVCEPNINFWSYLHSLSMDILIAYDVVCEGHLDADLFGCQLRDIVVDGRHYDKAVYDVSGGKDHYTDQEGVRHISVWMEDYKYIWQAHLEELMVRLAKAAYDAVKMESQLEDASRVYHRFGSMEYLGRRERYVCTTKCSPSADEKWPHFLYFKKMHGNRVVATEGPCAGKYPELWEAEDAIVEHWDGSCEEAFCIVVDSFEINSLSDIVGKIVWGFHDNGTSLTIYSDTLAGKQLAEFAEGCTLIPDYFNFAAVIPLTNFDMTKLMNSEWGKLYGPKLIIEQAKRLSRNKATAPSKSADTFGIATSVGL